MRRLVVLGTGTGVGKTYAGLQLVRGWRRRGHVAWGLKPIESGLESGDLAASDAERLRAGGPLPPAGIHFQALPAALSPHLAARQNGSEISVAEAARWVHKAEQSLDAIHGNAPHVMSLIEAAGGALTPLSTVATCADLAQALRPAHVLLVAPDALGVLHDVAATLLALAGLGCSVDFVLLCGSRTADASTGTNAAELEQVVFPRLRAAAPTVPQAFVLSAGSSDVSALLDAWTSASGR